MMKALAFYGLVLPLTITPVRCAEGGKIPYHFYNFEVPRFERGSLSGRPQGLRLVQGARITAASTTPDSAQHLVLDQHEPHSAVLLAGKRLAGDHRSHGEVWVRPQVHGDFSTGPTQLAIVPSLSSNKALSIQVTPRPMKSIRGK